MGKIQRISSNRFANLCNAVCQISALVAGIVVATGCIDAGKDSGIAPTPQFHIDSFTPAHARIGQTISITGWFGSDITPIVVAFASRGDTVAGVQVPVDSAIGNPVTNVLVRVPIMAVSGPISVRRGTQHAESRDTLHIASLEFRGADFALSNVSALFQGPVKLVDGDFLCSEWEYGQEPFTVDLPSVSFPFPDTIMRTDTPTIGFFGTSKGTFVLDFTKQLIDSFFIEADGHMCSGRWVPFEVGPDGTISASVAGTPLTQNRLRFWETVTLRIMDLGHCHYEGTGLWCATMLRDSSVMRLHFYP